MKVIEETAELKSKIQSATIGVSRLPHMQREALARQTHGSTAFVLSITTKSGAFSGIMRGSPRARQAVQVFPSCAT